MSLFNRWTRTVLESEARKRGIVAPQEASQPELLKNIVQHDYESSHGLRDNARKIVGSWLGSAAAAALPRLKHRGAPAALARDSQVPAAAAVPVARVSRQTPAPAAAPARTIEGKNQLVLARNQAELQLTWDVSASATQRARSLLGEFSQQGELALRVVSVRPDLATVVQSEVSEHGPVDPNGAWTLLLPSRDAHCVGSIGVRHGEHFISIVHESSRGNAS